MIELMASADIRRRLFTNSVLMLVSRIVTTIVSLVCVPIVISKLGLGGYGTWESLLAVAFLTTVLQGSISNTLLWRMSAAYGTKELAEMGRLARLGIAVSLVFFALVVPSVWTLRGWLVDVLNIQPAYVSSAAWVLPGIVAVMTLSGVNETLGALLGAYQRAGVASLVQSGHLLVFNGTAILGLLMDWGLWSMLLAHGSGFLFSFFAFYLCTSAACGRISLLPALPTRHDIRTTARYAGMLFVGQVSGAMREQVDKVVLAGFASQASVGVYGIAVRLASFVLVISTLFYSPLVAAAGALHAMGDWKGVRRLYSDVATILTICGSAAAVLIGGFYDRIIVLWMGHDVPDVGPTLFVLLLGNTAAMTIAGAGTALCKGIGRVGIDTGYTVFSLLSNVLLKVVLIATMGAIGSVVSSSASWAMASLLFVFLMHRSLELPREETRRALISLALAGTVIVLGRVASIHAPPAPDRLTAVWSIAGLGSIMLTVYLLLMVLCGGISVRSLQHHGRRVRSQLLRPMFSSIQR